MPSLKQLKEQNRVSRSALTDEGRGQLWPNMTSTEAAHTLQRWVNILVNVSRRIANLESMDSILLAVVQLSLRLLKADAAALVLWNDDRTQLEIKYQANPRKVFTVSDAHDTSPLLLRLLQSCRAYRYPDDFAASDHKWIFEGEEIKTGIIAPLCMNDLPVGGLWVGCYRHYPYHLVDLMGLKSLSEQATIALEHGMMKSQLQSLAVMEERSRIAREMHDSMVQILGYLSMQMLTLETLVREGNQETALQEIANARQNIKGAQADVREDILSLRTTLGAHDSAASALHRYFEEYGLQTGLKTNWLDETGEILKLSPLAEVQLVRIVQEALTNVRKHARAKSVWLRLELDRSDLVVTVRDDGIGFKPAEETRHFGLQTMRERAESIDGRFSVQSLPDIGSTVILRIPLVED